MKLPSLEVLSKANCLKTICHTVSSAPIYVGGRVCQAAAFVPVTLCAGVGHLLHKCGMTSKPKPISEYLVKPREIGSYIGNFVKIVVKKTSFVSSLPGKILGYFAGWVVGAVAGTVIVGAAKLSNAVFNTNFQPKTIAEYSILTSFALGPLGGIASRLALIMVNPVFIGPIIGSGFVFEQSDNYLGLTDGL